jgi:hypothetical protein
VCVHGGMGEVIKHALPSPSLPKPGRQGGATEQP